MIIVDDDGIMHDVVPMSVIEDIKAEINKTLESEKPYDEVFIFNAGLKYALKVIDKHIGENK